MVQKSVKTDLTKYVETNKCKYVENMMCLDDEHVCQYCNICRLYNKAKAEENKK